MHTHNICSWSVSGAWTRLTWSQHCRCCTAKSSPCPPLHICLTEIWRPGAWHLPHSGPHKTGQTQQEPGASSRSKRKWNVIDNLITKRTQTGQLNKTIQAFMCSKTWTPVYFTAILIKDYHKLAENYHGSTQVCNCPWNTSTLSYKDVGSGTAVSQISRHGRKDNGFLPFQSPNEYHSPLSQLSNWQRSQTTKPLLVTFRAKPLAINSFTSFSNYQLIAVQQS